jgi:hypothetical protein
MSSACAPSSDVLPSTAAASINEEQSNPVHPPSHEHTDVGMHLPFELQSFGHDPRTDGTAVVAGAIGTFTAAGGVRAAKPLRSEIHIGSAVGVSLGCIVGATVGLAVTASTNRSWRGDELVGPRLGSEVGSMVVGIFVCVGKTLGGMVAADGACVVGTCEGIPVEGTAEGCGVLGAALVGSMLGAGVVGAHDGGIVDGTPLGGGEGCQEGLGDVGMADGGIEGNKVGSRVGTSEGAGVGGRVSSEGAVEGREEEGGLVGIKLGLVEGTKVGTWEGWNDGAGVDTREGLPVGTSVGNPVLR